MKFHAGKFEYFFILTEYSEYRIEGTHNMTGVEQSTANFIEQRQLTEGEVNTLSLCH